MTTPTQGELRAWARSKGIAVGDRGRLPVAVNTAYAAAHSRTGAEPPGHRPTTPTLSPPGDLASRLRGLLDAVDTEVRAVGALSQRIDELVTALNGLRDEQARRLAVLDGLQAAAVDPGLGAFLKKVINPKTAQATEIIPARLR